MFRPLRLRRTLSPDSNADLDDVLDTKNALRDLGFMKVPDHGLNLFPDRPMFEGIRSFQRRNNLRVDSVMKPDGPTLRRLNRSLDERRSRTGPSPSLLPHASLQPSSPINDGTPDGNPPSRNARAPLFEISDGVGRNRRNRPRDILALEGALAAAGHLRPRASLAGDDELFDALKEFQLASGLRTDGWAGRGGETVKALSALLAGPLAEAETSRSAQAAASRAGASEREKDLCDERFRRELQRCTRLPGRWHGPCAQRAMIRWGLCYRYGYTPGPDGEPPEWGPGDMEEGFSPNR